VKTDGEYIYAVSGNKVVILKAYPPDEARVLSQISLNGTIMGIFVNGDRMVVFEAETPPSLIYFYVISTSYYMSENAFIKVYDISDREAPLLKRDIALNGSYFSSRMIGDYVYAVINQPAYRYENEVNLPGIYSGGKVEVISPDEIYYANVSDIGYTFTTVVAINVQNDEQEPTHETFLLGATRCMYVSLNNIYVTFSGQWWWDVERTLIYRIHVEGDEIIGEASGNVTGSVLNQFSMDEHNGYFRIATTTGSWSTSSQNNVYVLDMNLNVAGKLEGLATGERIYSARFMGDRCYLVTFRQTDPFFVIDVGNPVEPKVLGYLKIPGFSSYLHPYDENHIIGIGKEGSNVKLSLFDVTNVTTPIETAKYVVEASWSDSSVLWDQKAFLFDKSKQLLALPISIGWNWYYSNSWQGAYVFNISLEQGLTLKGNITHQNGMNQFGSGLEVKRILYIDNVLYTISDKKIKLNSLENLEEINEVEIP
jgi:uncharacterized secreted protein with C-terminal beta-propeller domain